MVRRESQKQEAEQIYQSKGIKAELLNARQVFSKARGSIPSEELLRPNRCHQVAPSKPNVYTDGSLWHGRRPIWSLGAAGLWWPLRDATHISPAEFELASWEEEQGGLKMCTALPGFGGSSTRTELCAGILALASDNPVNVGTDSKAFMDKARYVIDLVAKGQQPRRPWGSHRDGDLWAIFHQFAIAKGHEAIRVTKVKGHATSVMAEKGEVEAEDEKGNDSADAAAKQGNELHGEGICKIASWFAGRQQRYIYLIKDIHTYLIEGAAIKKDT